MADVSDKSCQHERWEVRLGNTVGFGQCFDCDQEIGINVLFNGLRDRMLRAIFECQMATNAANNTVLNATNSFK